MKNAKEFEKMINSSPKTGNSLIIPIGYSGEVIKELSLSCRGKIRDRYGNISNGSINGYAVFCGIKEEGENLISGLMLNLCKKYLPSEALLSYYNVSDIPCKAFDFLQYLPNVDKICQSAVGERLETEIEVLKSEYEARYRQIDRYADCYARAVNSVQKDVEGLGLPQKVLVFRIPYSRYDHRVKNQLEKHIHFLTQELWRVGIYPIVLFADDSADSDFGSLAYYLGCNVILSSSRRARDKYEEMKSGEALVYNAEGSETFSIPHYDGRWISEAISSLAERGK